MKTPLLATACALLTACGPSYEFDGSLRSMMEAQPERFGTVIEDPERYRVQIIYTQIDRDDRGQPVFSSYKFRVDANEYFYPASTVKLPVAVLALEKLKRLDRDGLDRDTTMITGSKAPFHTDAATDDTAPGGLPSVGQYVRKILAVSDNDAYNRLYEFLGPRAINEALHERGFADTRIVHRLEIFLTPSQNAWTNPIRFLQGDTVVHEQPAVREAVYYPDHVPILLGEADIVDGERVEGPKDFGAKNAYPLQALHDTVKTLVFPESVLAKNRFDLTDDDRRFLLRHMALYPDETGIDAYADATKYPQGYVKFLIYGGDEPQLPSNIRIFNKVGDAYGFLTDAAYIVDFDAGIEFLLAATIYTNANETFNDNTYEYEKVGLPFLRELGQAIYDVERERPRQSTPDLAPLQALFVPKD